MKRCLPLALLALAACATPPTAVHQPYTARPQPAAVAAANGSIWQNASNRSLFEDRRARRVGDTLTINIAERTQASKQSSASAQRSASTTAALPTIAGAPLKFLAGLSVDGSNTTNFEGEGDAAANNNFTGTITVTVIEELANGNLLVSGEKQVAINQGDEFIRFSGVINPAYISAANTVQSTQVADARLEYKARGYIDEAQTMAWLQRIFLSVLPF